MRAVTTLVAISLVLGLAAAAPAQSTETRPAVTTSWGDTGLWFVPTADVLPAGAFSTSVHRTEVDFRQGNTNVSSFPITAAIGIPRVELFGALHVVTRIDRDTSPLLFGSTNGGAGGLVNEFPTVTESFTGSHLGDLYLGAKLNVSTQADRQPIAFALRGTAKIPTADTKYGIGTGKLDGFFDLIASGVAGGIELSAFGGGAFRGDPQDISISDGLRWGGGLALPARGALRFTAETFGEYLFDKAVTAPAGLLVGTDGSRSPAASLLDNDVTSSFGLTWQSHGGVLLGAAFSYRWDLPEDSRSGTSGNTSRDAIGLQFRIGYHPGVRTYVPPPPPVARELPVPPPVPPMPPAPPVVAAPVAALAAVPPMPAANLPPRVRASCDPCTVITGQSLMLRAQGTDPDGEPLTYQWKGTGGTMQDPGGATTAWRAGIIPTTEWLTVTVTDSRGSTGFDTIRLSVIPSQIDFDTVHFESDQFTLSAQGQQALDTAVRALMDQPAARIQIEGHTDSQGSQEYNLALGDRRANSVREYLTAHGIAASRLSTVSFGEEKPAASNDDAPGRARNRRALLMVRITP